MTLQFTGYDIFFRAALDSILGDIKDDLADFGVTYDQWFSEKTLADDGSIDKVVKILQDKGHIYEKGGALWFKSTDFGDEKDRVVKRRNGQTTYFASPSSTVMVAFPWVPVAIV